MASKRLDDIIQAAVDVRLLNENGELLPWSSPDYQKAADKINTREDCPNISRDYLYIILKNNRYNLLDTLRSKYGIQVSLKSPNNMIENECNDEDETENNTITDEGRIALNVYPNTMNSFENFSSKIPFWNVDLPKSPWDIDEDSENLDVLCELVRNQYLKRLRQTLLDNLDASEGYQKKSLYEIQQCVDICMAEMEKQALRRCMIASIYREGMSNMINEVKSCSKNSMLYVLLKRIIVSNNQLSLWDKYFGTENKTNKSVSFGVNTEEKPYKVASTQTEVWMDPGNDLPFINKINTDSVNKSNLSISSYDVKSKMTESNVFDSLSSLLKSSPCASNSSSDIPMEINHVCDSTKFTNLQECLKQENSVINDKLSINALLRDLQDSPEYEQQSSKLENRLVAFKSEKPMENFTDFPAPIEISPNIVRTNKINEILKDKFKSERVAKTYELRKSMNELPQELQIRLSQKFDDLFGNGHTYESDPLSEEEERIIAHKRIVKMVVQFMTPYYKAQRITRHLFKTLAKLISKNLMDRSYDPGEDTVAKGVREFFTENRCIKTIEDIYQ